MRFEFPLGEERVKKQQVITLHLIVTFSLLATGAFLLLIQYLLNSLSGDQRMAFDAFAGSGAWGLAILFSGLLLLGGIIFRNNWLFAKKTSMVIRLLELALLAGIATMAISKGLVVPALIYGIIAGAVVFSFYWETISDNTLYVSVSEQGIKLPVTCRKRSLRWSEVEQVIFRFGTLTIDCYDNRLFQWSIQSAAFDKESFQRFCTEHIAKSKEHRKEELAW